MNGSLFNLSSPAALLRGAKLQLNPRGHEVRSARVPPSAFIRAAGSGRGAPLGSLSDTDEPPDPARSEVLCAHRARLHLIHFEKNDPQCFPCTSSLFTPLLSLVKPVNQLDGDTEHKLHDPRTGKQCSLFVSQGRWARPAVLLWDSCVFPARRSGSGCPREQGCNVLTLECTALMMPTCK